MSFNSIVEQKRIWGHLVKQPQEELYSYQWGNPETEITYSVHGDVLGNYKKIKDEYLLPHITDKAVLDLGCFDGKWTQYMDKAVITAADLFSDGFSMLRERLAPPKYNIRFVEIDGTSLRPIESHSIDYIFCMDALVRSEMAIIDYYMHEFKRVLRKDGKACIHLPCKEQPMSVQRGFTPVSKYDISAWAETAGFSGLNDFRIDSNTVNHGVLFLINL